MQRDVPHRCYGMTLGTDRNTALGCGSGTQNRTSHQSLLDSGYYERGLRARRDAHNLLDDVASVLADVESRADRVFFG